MKDMAIVSLVIIVVSLMVFMYFAKRQEKKILQMTKVDSETEGNPFMESIVQESAIQDAVMMDLYQRKEK